MAGLKRLMDDGAEQMYRAPLTGSSDPKCSPFNSNLAATCRLTPRAGCSSASIADAAVAAAVIAALKVPTAPTP